MTWPPTIHQDVQDAVTTLRTASFLVTNYGAVGNGVTDDAAAIQAAITAAQSAGGGTVFFPPGTYKLSVALSVNADGVILQGSGPATILQSASSTTDVVDFGDGVTTRSNLGIRSLRINNSGGQKTAGTGIKLNKCFKVWLSDLLIEQQYRAVHILNTTQVWFRDSDIRNTKENAVTIEADLSSGYETFLSNIVADNPNVSNSGCGLAWLGSEALLLSNCDFIRFNVGMNVNPGAGRECRFGFIAGGSFDTAGDNGVHITNTSTGNTVGLTFTNCWVGTATNYGVLMERQGSGIVQGVRWVGGKVFHNGLAGLRMAGGQDLHISDCDIIGNSQTVSAARHGVEIGGAFTNWSVMNCRIGGGYEQGNTQGYAVSVDAGAADYYRIIGNDMATGNNNTPSLNDAGTGTHKVVANNLTT